MRERALAAAVTDAEAVELLHRMVGIASVSGSEDDLGLFLAAQLAGLGFDTHRDEVGNVIGSLGDADAPTIMLLGHMDTVPGGPPLRIDGDRLYGRGAVDAKGPLAAMIVAASRANRPDGVRIMVVGVVDEERDSVGAHKIVATQRADAVVIGEPSGAGTVVVGYKGVLRFACSVRRPQAHTSSPEPTASEVAARFWQSLLDFTGTGTQDGPVFQQLSPTLVRMSGTLIDAELVVSCRTPMGFDATAFLADVAKLALTIDEGTEITVLEDTPAVRTSRADPVARALARSIRDRTGDVEFKVKLGTSDMNVLGPAWQVPIATYGPGDPHQDHTPDEHIVLSEYLLAAAILTDAVDRLATGLAALSTSHLGRTPSQT